MKRIVLQLFSRFIVCVFVVFSFFIYSNSVHAGNEPLYRTVCIPELEYFSFSNYSYASTQTLHGFGKNDVLRDLWEETGFIRKTDFTDVPFEEAESYNLQCDVGKGINLHFKSQVYGKNLNSIYHDLKIKYGDSKIYEGEISQGDFSYPKALKSLEYTGGQFTLENYMTSWPLMQLISLNVEYFPKLLNPTNGILSDEHEAFKLPFTLEKFLNYIQPEEEMAVYEPQPTMKRFPPDANQDFVEFLHITCTPQIEHFSLRRIKVDAKFAEQYNKDGLAEKLWEKYGVIYTTDSSDQLFEDADQLEIDYDGDEYKPKLKLIVKRQLVPDNQKKCEHEIREYFQFLHDGNIIYEGVGTDDFCNDPTTIELLEFDGDRLKINARSNESYIEILDWPASKSHYEYDEAPLDFEALKFKMQQPNQ